MPVDFSRQLDALSDCWLRKDWEKMKNEWLSTRSELEELRQGKASVEDALNQEREEHLQAIESLKEDCEYMTIFFLLSVMTCQYSSKSMTAFRLHYIYIYI